MSFKNIPRLDPAFSGTGSKVSGTTPFNMASWTLAAGIFPALAANPKFTLPQLAGLISQNISSDPSGNNQFSAVTIQHQQIYWSLPTESQPPWSQFDRAVQELCSQQGWRIASTARPGSTSSTKASANTGFPAATSRPGSSDQFDIGTLVDQANLGDRQALGKLYEYAGGSHPQITHGGSGLLTITSDMVAKIPTNHKCYAIDVQSFGFYNGPGGSSHEFGDGVLKFTAQRLAGIKGARVYHASGPTLLVVVDPKLNPDISASQVKNAVETGPQIVDGVDLRNVKVTSKRTGNTHYGLKVNVAGTDPDINGIGAAIEHARSGTSARPIVSENTLPGLNNNLDHRSHINDRVEKAIAALDVPADFVRVVEDLQGQKLNPEQAAGLVDQYRRNTWLSGHDPSGLTLFESPEVYQAKTQADIQAGKPTALACLDGNKWGSVGQEHGRVVADRVIADLGNIAFDLAAKYELNTGRASGSDEWSFSGRPENVKKFMEEFIAAQEKFDPLYDINGQKVRPAKRNSQGRVLDKFGAAFAYTEITDAASFDMYQTLKKLDAFTSVAKQKGGGPTTSSSFGDTPGTLPKDITDHSQVRAFDGKVKVTVPKGGTGTLNFSEINVFGENLEAITGNSAFSLRSFASSLLGRQTVLEIEGQGEILAKSNSPIEITDNSIRVKHSFLKLSWATGAKIRPDIGGRINLTIKQTWNNPWVGTPARDALSFGAANFLASFAIHGVLDHRLPTGEELWDETSGGIWGGISFGLRRTGLAKIGLLERHTIPALIVLDNLNGLAATPAEFQGRSLFNSGVGLTSFFFGMNLANTALAKAPIPDWAKLTISLGAGVFSQTVGQETFSNISENNPAVKEFVDNPVVSTLGQMIGTFYQPFSPAYYSGRFLGNNGLDQNKPLVAASRLLWDFSVNALEYKALASGAVSLPVLAVTSAVLLTGDELSDQIAFCLENRASWDAYAVTSGGRLLNLPAKIFSYVFGLPEAVGTTLGGDGEFTWNWYNHAQARENAFQEFLPVKFDRLDDNGQVVYWDASGLDNTVGHLFANPLGPAQYFSYFFGHDELGDKVSSARHALESGQVGQAADHVLSSPQTAVATAAYFVDERLGDAAAALVQEIIPRAADKIERVVEPLKTELANTFASPEGILATGAYFINDNWGEAVSTFATETLPQVLTDTRQTTEEILSDAGYWTGKVRQEGIVNTAGQFIKSLR